MICMHLIHFIIKPPENNIIWEQNKKTKMGWGIEGSLYYMISITISIIREYSNQIACIYKL